MNKKMIGIMLCLLAMMSCTVEDGENVPNNNYAFEEISHEYDGEFSIDWVVNGATIDTTRLLVNSQAKVLNMPFKWLHQLIFPTAQTVALCEEGSDASHWNMNTSITGYSDVNIYFGIKGIVYQRKVMVDGKEQDYKLFFSPDKSVAIYYQAWDAWSAIIPIDSIQVKQSHTGEVATSRYKPAISLTFNSTRRTKH